jgi:F0F1-type ATP synthase membrane subunit a
MGESAAQTVREIEETRERLDAELRELESRLPSAAVWTKRAIGMVVGGGIGATAFLFALRRLRKRKKQKAPETQVQAVINVLPEGLARSISDAIEDGRWRQWAGFALGAWMLVRLAELRQLRRMNRALFARVPPPRAI